MWEESISFLNVLNLSIIVLFFPACSGSLYKSTYKDYPELELITKEEIIHDDLQPAWPVEHEKTILGIDSDHDGIRDDVEIWLNQVIFKHHDSDLSADALKASRQLAKAFQLELMAAANREYSKCNEINEHHIIPAYKCLIYNSTYHSHDLFHRIHDLVYNNNARRDVFTSYQEQCPWKATKIDENINDLIKYCSFNATHKIHKIVNDEQKDKANMDALQLHFCERHQQQIEEERRLFVPDRHYPSNSRINSGLFAGTSGIGLETTYLINKPVFLRWKDLYVGKRSDIYEGFSLGGQKNAYYLEYQITHTISDWVNSFSVGVGARRQRSITTYQVTAAVQALFFAPYFRFYGQQFKGSEAEAGLFLKVPYEIK